MLFDIAITPDVFEYVNLHSGEERELENLWAYLGDNVLIANLYGGEWAKFVGKLELKPTIKDKIRHRLIKYHNTHKIFECPSGEVLNPVDNWFKVALMELKKGAIDAIVTCESTRITNNVSNAAIIDFPIDPRDSFVKRIKDSQQQSVTKEKSRLRAILTPFLRHAKSVKLIDPYIFPYDSSEKRGKQTEDENEKRNRYKNIIGLIAELLGNYQNYQTPGTIEIFTSVSKNDQKKRKEQIEKDLDLYKSEWETFLIDISRKLYNHNVTIILLSVDQNNQFLHDRYILTELAGISLPAGIEENKTKEEIWTLLQERNWRREYLKYTYRVPYRIEKKISFNLFIKP
ncbi:MAG: hypothetical protein HYZ25_16075 [Chloroflexi bacterium]|nr:hypothetical protein [Chloroflexota bacterium]